MHVGYEVLGKGFSANEVKKAISPRPFEEGIDGKGDRRADSTTPN